MDTKLNLIPTAGYIILEQEKAESTTASGIVLPDSSGEKPSTGIVLSVGDDEVLESGAKKSSPVKTGDKVIYKKWGGNEISYQGKDLLFVKFEDILAIKK